MQKKYLTWSFRVGALSVLSALVLFVVSCSDDDGPTPVAATANFTFVVNPDQSGSVAFTNTSINGKEYSWDFGDGSESTEESPVHVYAASGTYTVELSALGDAGTAVSKKTASVVVVKVAENVLEGGDFETADASKWTIVGTGAPKLPKVEFGVTANLPTGGTGGGLRVSNPDGLTTGDQVEMVMYRSIQLEAGKTYEVSALIKHGPLTATDVADGGPKEAFLSIEFSDAAPSGTGQWKTVANTDTKVLLHRYCVCWMGASLADGANGEWLNSYTANWISYYSGNKDVLEITVPTTGTYYVGFKAGLGTAAGATFSSSGFVVDNLVISEK